MRHCPLPSGDEVARDLFSTVHLSGHSLYGRDRCWMAARFSIAHVGRHDASRSSICQGAKAQLIDDNLLRERPCRRHRLIPMSLIPRPPIPY